MKRLALLAGSEIIDDVQKPGYVAEPTQFCGVTRLAVMAPLDDA
jgi:hypothetical protein